VFLDSLIAAERKHDSAAVQFGQLSTTLRSSKSGDVF
jgi:hypothetical protein